MRLVVLRLSVFLATCGSCATAIADEPLSAAAPDGAWDAVFDRADGWIGGDAIYSTPLPGGDVLWLFADTYLGQVRDGLRQPGVRMVNNTLARHRLSTAGVAPDPAAVKFLWGSPPDTKSAKAWIQPDTKLQAGPRTGAGDWYWVADATLLPGLAKNERLVIFLWRTARTTGGALGFKSVGCALAIIDDPVADWSSWQSGQFAIPDTFPTNAAQEQESTSEILWGSDLFVDSQADEGTTLYIFGCRLRPMGANELVVSRVPARHVEDMTQWRFRTADGWSERSADAAGVASTVTTEFSVSKLEIGGKPSWVLVQSEPWFGTRILARTSESMFGPWSAPKPVYQVPNVDSKKKHFTYAAKAHPELSRPRGLLVTYVVNSFDFGESSTNAAIYRPRFVRVPASVLPEAPPSK